jgi:hypothetical protein
MSEFLEDILQEQLFSEAFEDHSQRSRPSQVLHTSIWDQTAELTANMGHVSEIETDEAQILSSPQANLTETLSGANEATTWEHTAETIAKMEHVCNLSYSCIIICPEKGFPKTMLTRTCCRFLVSMAMGRT